MSDEIERRNTIRDLNDKFRKALPAPVGISGLLMLTQGIQQLTEDEGEPGNYLPALLEQLRDFDRFDADNDPYGEHDFGAFEFQGAKLFWKVDYYAQDMMNGADDPTDPVNTLRVLTVMLAEEY